MKTNLNIADENVLENISHWTGVLILGNVEILRSQFLQLTSSAEYNCLGKAKLSVKSKKRSKNCDSKEQK